MAIDLNDEIVQDFLVEAGEILDHLGNQLVDLEQRPSDKDLLNSVFRGFHTIKGGAGFLALDPMVAVAHKAEDIFDLLRKGERHVDAALMDVFLQVLDVLHEMFSDIRAGSDLTAAPPVLMEALIKLARNEPLDSAPAKPQSAPAALAAAAEPEPEPEPEQPALAPVAAAPAPESAPAAEAASGEPSTDDITEAEFEALLDALYVQKTAEAAAAPAVAVPADASSEAISEDEFDRLLDQLQAQGQGFAAGIKVDATAPAPAPEASPPPVVAVEPPPAPREELRRAEPPVKREAGEPEAAPAKAQKGGAPAAQQADTTVRVETSVLDRIMNMVGELVLIRNRISTLEAAIGNEEMTKTASILDVVTTDLQAAVMKTRMQPVKKVFGRFPRVVRDLARSLNKEVNLELHGEDTDLDKNLVEALADPMVHLVRNAVDHGIEMPAARVAKGKPREGTVKLSAAQEGDHILLTIEDDGAGMDPEVLRRKAVEKGMMDEDAVARLDESDCYALIFAAGFSTKSEISDISGRGVGMDVVKTRINQLNGTISIHSVLGKGSTISIKLPLTLAIVPTLMVVLGKQIFALPLVNVNEILDYDQDKTNVVDGQQMMIVRGKALPVFYLSQWLIRGRYERRTKGGHVVIVTIGNNSFGLQVDQLIGQEEVVIKPLGAMLHGTKGLAGATITGDGRIALILDLPTLINTYAQRC